MTRPRRTARPAAWLALALSLGPAALPAAAHDTWFEADRSAPAAAGAWPLRLGTGAHFPLREQALDPQHVAASGCDTGPLQPLGLQPDALALQAPAAATTCWLQVAPFELTLPAALVPVYLAEVNPPAAVRDAWQALAARGQPWRERYVKHARVLRGGATWSGPATMGLDVTLEATAPYRFRLWRDGRPLAGFAVELRHERAAHGVWRRTDAEGRLIFHPTLPGAWLLRGVDLRLAEDDAGRWDSRFVTLAFEVPPGAPAALQKGISASPNARSANQPAATSAMAQEPAANTPVR